MPAFQTSFKKSQAQQSRSRTKKTHLHDAISHKLTSPRGSLANEVKLSLIHANRQTSIAFYLRISRNTAQHGQNPANPLAHNLRIRNMMGNALIAALVAWNYHVARRYSGGDQWALRRGVCAPARGGWGEVLGYFRAVPGRRDDGEMVEGVVERVCWSCEDGV
jgi:hypothetical protein